jgi:hypothetical protein
MRGQPDPTVPSVMCLGPTYSWQNLRVFSTSFIAIIHTLYTLHTLHVHLMYIEPTDDSDGRHGFLTSLNTL